jgi:hypothetical protein
MKRWLKETLFVMLATWAIDGAVDHWAFGHQHSAYDLSTMIPKGLAFDSKALTASSYWTYFNLRFADGRFSADSA